MKSLITLPLGMEHQMTVPLRMMQQLDHTPLGPVMSDGSSAPVQDNGGVRDGQEVGARMVDLYGVTVLQKSHSEVV